MLAWNSLEICLSEHLKDVHRHALSLGLHAQSLDFFFLIEVERPTLNVGSIMSLGNEVSRMRIKMEPKRSTGDWAVGIDGAGKKTEASLSSSVVTVHSVQVERHSPNGPGTQRRWHHDHEKRSHMSGGVT